MGALFYAGLVLYIVNCKNVLCKGAKSINCFEDNYHKTPGQRAMTGVLIFLGLFDAKRLALPAVFSLCGTS